VGFVLASNMVNSDARASIVNTKPATLRPLKVGAGGLEVSASDDSRVLSDVDLAATKGREGELAQAVRSFAGLYGVSFSDYSGVRRVIAGDRVRVGGPDYTTFDRPDSVLAGERVEIKGDLGDIPHNSLYEYIGKTPLEGPQLDRVDYSDTSAWRKINGIAGKTYVFKGLTASLDLGVENYEDNSRWLGLDLDDFVDTAAAAAEAGGEIPVGFVDEAAAEGLTEDDAAAFDEEGGDVSLG
jgi:hypothetical protein